MNLSIVISASAALLLSILSLRLLDAYYWSSIRSLLPFTRSSPVADLIVWNGTIYTSDASLLFADSMAIRSGRVLRVGSYSSLKELVHSGTKQLDLGGKVVVSGFIDSHVHMIFGGLQMGRVELRAVNRKEEFVRTIEEAARNSKSGSWILGGGWNNDLWGGELPVASWIDEVTPANPVWVTRMDGHMGLANSVALEVAGVSKLSKDPKGGTIARTADGELTGLLIDSAMKLFLGSIPEVSLNERREALVRASKYVLTKGVTTVVDFGRYYPGAPVEFSWQDFSDVYQWADSSGRMIMRVCLFFPMETWQLLLDQINKFGRVLSQWIYLGGVKAFADGSLGSSSALFHEPYVNEPHNRGLQLIEHERLLNMTVASDKSGLQVIAQPLFCCFQVAIHAIGDKANDLVLDVYQSVTSINGVRDRRFRIEHAQHLAMGAAARFSQHGIIASVQHFVVKHFTCDAFSWMQLMTTYLMMLILHQRSLERKGLTLDLTYFNHF
ncbi:protein LONG AFTER FAR-RED 3 isoform X4 [Rhodamnia argentea]|uniref:Protein LONG AFTER FAR-RED 3 isoform X4 n=1 Tax=Rhodamnia argentea TaxID=178133 RepID=A0ABM3HCQ0_9MYRT|nr:protein LONG AFTER FAR-RED 3 isoform X4 [Rhodamnia argentea]